MISNRCTNKNISFQPKNSSSIPKKVTIKYFKLILDTLSSDIAAELEKLRKAEYVIFIHPLWWGSVPAILKGWADRVLVCAENGAYDFKHMFNTGLLKGKKGLTITTSGGPVDFFSPQTP